MTPSNRLDQLVELTGNISNAFSIALYKADLDNKILVLRHHISLSSNFNTEAKINFVDMSTPVEVYCNFHQKTWPVSPKSHARSDGTGSECRYCHGFGRTTQDFIDAATTLGGRPVV